MYILVPAKVALSAETRPYLSSEKRRRQLLDAASRLFVREGLAGMTMVAVAREAGASRRLVYDHFTDLAALYEAFFDDRASRYLAELDRAIDAAGADGPVVAAFTALLAVPTEDQRAIRLLVADTSTPELDGIRARLRRRLETRWMTRLAERGIDEHLARAVLWTSMGTILSLADLAGRAEITREQAIELASTVVQALAGVATLGQTATTPEAAERTQR